MNSSSSVPALHHKYPRQEFPIMSDSPPLSGVQLSELDASAPDPKDENYTSAPNQPSDSPSEPASGSSSSCSSLVSQTSTIRYEQENFELYSIRVKELCHLLWPNSSKTSSPNEFHIERLKGGTFHRIIGITIKLSSHSTERLVLRIPRDDDSHADREVAIVNFVRQYPSIPVPEIKAFDCAEDNLLNSPYVIQSRIPGHDLQSLEYSWPTLTHQQKCRDFGKILRSLQDIHSPTPGRIDVSASDGTPQVFAVKPFEVGQRSKDGDSTKVDLDRESSAKTAPKYDDTLGFFVSQFDRWRVSEEPGDLGDKYFDCISNVARQMDDMGFLGGDGYWLCHLDLNSAPRNVIVDIQPEVSAAISGILDWDSAVFGPRFVGCAPPMWLWAWNSEGDEDEREADNTSPTLEQQELKRLFEEAVGPDFLKHSYGPQYQLGRTMFDLALRGKNWNYEMNEIDDIVREWAMMRAPEMPLIKDPREIEHDENEAFYKELAAQDEEIERKLLYVDYMESRRAEGIDDDDVTDYENWQEDEDAQESGGTPEDK